MGQCHSQFPKLADLQRRFRGEGTADDLDVRQPLKPCKCLMCDPLHPLRNAVTSIMVPGKVQRYYMLEDGGDVQVLEPHFTNTKNIFVIFVSNGVGVFFKQAQMRLLPVSPYQWGFMVLEDGHVWPIQDDQDHPEPPGCRVAIIKATLTHELIAQLAQT